MPVPSRILIYGLLNPVEVELFYVGQTRKRREFRLLEHMEEKPQKAPKSFYNRYRYGTSGIAPSSRFPTIMKAVPKKNHSRNSSLKP